MIELHSDTLKFSFPEVHPDAKFEISFQRTLRIPDDGTTYPLPPSLGEFPLKHVDDHAGRVPQPWLERGGVMLPMYQSEALWLRFQQGDTDQEYPFAIKVATGKQCAVSGKTWRNGLHRRPQNYMVSSEQPWLDGYSVDEQSIRQFVAMPLGAGYTAEEQLTGKAEYGGMQLEVFPMKRRVFERRFPKVKHIDRMECLASAPVTYCSADMGMAPGGKMTQEIYRDPFHLSDWEIDVSSRCFVHLCNSLVWHSITDAEPPHPAPTAKHYTEAGFPWFDYYSESGKALQGSSALAGLKSVAEIADATGTVALPENASVAPETVITYGKPRRKGQVRECKF